MYLLDTHKCWQWAKNLILSPCNLYRYFKIHICSRRHKCSPIHVFLSLAHRNVTFVAFLIYKEGHMTNFNQWNSRLVCHIWTETFERYCTTCCSSLPHFYRHTDFLFVQPTHQACPQCFFWFEYLHPFHHRDKG